LEYLRQGGCSDTFNCGYGKGYSVREVIQTIELVSEKPLPIQSAPRRAKDIIAIYSDPTKIKQTLGWAPQYESLELICKTSLDWEKSRKARGQDSFT
jgi:UDP-glucose 4-epimerase